MNVTISARSVYYNILYCKYVVTWKGKSDSSNGTDYQSKLIIVHSYCICFKFGSISNNSLNAF